MSSEWSRSEGWSGVVGLTWWVVSINLLLNYDRVLRLGIGVDVEAALTAQIAARSGACELHAVGIAMATFYRRPCSADAACHDARHGSASECRIRS